MNLTRLRAWADEWDEEGDGACWAVSRFVAWVERNLADNGNLERAKALRQLGHQNRRSAPG